MDTKDSMVVAKIVDGLNPSVLLGYCFKSFYTGKYTNYRLNDARKLLGKDAPDRTDLPSLFYYDKDICDEIEFLSMTGREDEITDEVVNRVYQATGIQYNIYRVNIDKENKKHRYTLARLLDAKQSGASVVSVFEDILYEAGIDAVMFKTEDGSGIGIDCEMLKGLSRLKWILGLDVRKDKAYLEDSFGSKVEIPMKSVNVVRNYNMNVLYFDDMTLVKDRLPEE